MKVGAWIHNAGSVGSAFARQFESASAALDCRLEAICVGNELREGGDAWGSKRFTSRISYGLARVLEEYRKK